MQPKKTAWNCRAWQRSMRFTKRPAKTATTIWITPPRLCCWKSGQGCGRRESFPNLDIFPVLNAKFGRTVHAGKNLLCRNYMNPTHNGRKMPAKFSACFLLAQDPRDSRCYPLEL